MRPYWTFRDELAMIDEIAIEGEAVILPSDIQQLALEQHLHKPYEHRKDDVSSTIISVLVQHE